MLPLDFFTVEELLLAVLEDEVEATADLLEVCFRGSLNNEESSVNIINFPTISKSLRAEDDEEEEVAPDLWWWREEEDECFAAVDEEEEPFSVPAFLTNTLKPIFWIEEKLYTYDIEN